jgi:hypothetical protein
MGTARARSRNSKTYSPGSYETGYYPGGVWTHLSTTLGSSLDNVGETCNDTLGPYPFVEPHGLTLIKRSVTPLKFYGEAKLSGTNVRRHSGYNPQNWSGYIYVSDPSPTNWNYWKAKALASINPFKPRMDLPLFLFELREFPRMLMNAGKVLNGSLKPSSVPGGYLSYNFGWAPLVSDLLSLMNLRKSLENTHRTLQNAAKGGRVAHRLGTLISNGSPQTESYALGTAGTYQLSYYSRTQITGWCTARVHLTEPLPTVDKDLESYIRQVTLGLSLRPGLLWDAMPWSWLIDYFTNIGDLMEARGGYSAWRFSDLFCMVSTSVETKITHELNKVGSMSFSGGKKSYIRKERSFMGSDPTVGLAFSPFISEYQGTIIGALLTASAFRKHSAFS